METKSIYSNPTWEVVESNYDIPVGTLFRSTFAYTNTDPYALRLFFEDAGCTRHRGTVCMCSDAWEFARDLLVHGLYSPTGDGDVAFRPYTDKFTCAQFICMTISNGSFTMSVITPSPRMYAFVRRMLKLVPVGTESDFIDVDKLISRINEVEGQRW